MADTETAQDGAAAVAGVEADAGPDAGPEKKMRKNPRPFRLVTKGGDVFEVKKPWPKPVGTDGFQNVECTIEAIFDFEDEFDDVVVGDHTERTLASAAHWEVIGLPMMLVPTDHKDPRACREDPAKNEIVNPQIDPATRLPTPEFQALKVHIDKTTNRAVRFGTFFLHKAGVIAQIPDSDVCRVEYRQDLEDLLDYVHEEQRIRYAEPPKAKDGEAKPADGAPAAPVAASAPNFFQPPAAVP
jgi:hypothetical protein